MFSTSSLALSYSISTNPNPIQISSGAEIEIVFNNNSASAIDLQALDIKIPVGDNAQELTADANDVNYQVTPNGTPQSPIWDISLNVGTVSLTSHNGKPISITTEGYTIQLSHIKINQVVGQCILELIETTGTTEQDKKVNNGQLQCSKFPAKFSLSDFNAVDSTGAVVLQVNPGTPVWLTWTADLMSSTTLYLSYPNNLPVDVTNCHVSGSNQYRYPSDTTGILINNDDKIFTLEVNHEMPDGTVLQTSYQYMVNVLQLAKVLTLTTDEIGDQILVGQGVTILWTVNDATAYSHLYCDGVFINKFTDYSCHYLASPSYTTTYRIEVYNQQEIQDDSRIMTVNVYKLQMNTTMEVGSPGSIAGSVAVTPDGKCVYVGGNAWVTVVDNITLSYKERILVNTGMFETLITGIAVATERGEYAYVTANSGIAVIDIHQSKVVQTIPMKNRPRDIAITPDGKQAYVINDSDGNVSVIDTAKGAIVQDILVGSSTMDIAITPDGKYAYVLGEGVSVIDTATRTVVQNISIQESFNVRNIAIMPDGKYVYVTNFGEMMPQIYDTGSVFLIDVEKRTVIQNISVGMRHPYGIAITSDGKYIYVANYDGNVAVLDTAKSIVVQNISMPENFHPWGIAFASNENAYVIGFGDDNRDSKSNLAMIQKILVQAPALSLFNERHKLESSVSTSLNLDILTSPVLEQNKGPTIQEQPVTTVLQFSSPTHFQQEFKKEVEHKKTRKVSNLT